MQRAIAGLLTIVVVVLAVLVVQHVVPPTLLSPTVFRAKPMEEQIRLLRSWGKRVAFEKLKDLVERAYPDQPPAGHDVSHVLGEILIAQKGLSGFAECDTFLSYGCYHGAGLAAARIGVDREKTLEKLAQVCIASPAKTGGCLHGLGHTVIILYDYDLIGSYQTCERLLSKPEDQFWCEDGVTMEDITRSMATPSSPNSVVAGAPFSPCDTVPKAYEATCVRNYLGVFRGRNEMTFDQIASYCRTFRPGTRTHDECFRSVGTLAVRQNLDRVPAALASCNTLGSDAIYCVEGIAMPLAGARRTQVAQDVCDTLASLFLREPCHTWVTSISFKE